VTSAIVPDTFWQFVPMQPRKSSPYDMSGNLARLSVCAAASLIAGYSGATCLNNENTSVPESTPTSSHIVHPDGTLTAPATGLMWKRCLEGQTLVDGVCNGAPTFFTWPDALDAADATSFAGHGDWRLPNPKELLSIIEDRCAAPGLNFNLFPITGDFGVFGTFGMWTATPTALFAQDTYYLIWILFSDGVVFATSDLQEIPLLLVRDLP